jgi:hypothetical protein
MEGEIIRKLSKVEIMYDNEVHHNNLVLTRVFLVQVTAEVSLDLLKRAATFWAKRHPFLRAEIKRTPDEYERYFVHLSNEKAFKFDNVEFLAENETTKWMDIMDRDKATLFNMNEGPLWRLKFIKLARTEHNLDYNHAFILTTQHPIGDGRNCYEIGVQFLNIVAALLENKTCDEMNENVIEHSRFTCDELIAQRGLTYEHEIVEHDEDNRDSKKLFNAAAENPQYGFEYYCLKADRMSELKLKVKENAKRAKMASVLAVLLGTAFKSLYRKHGVDDIPLNKFQYYLLASVREKLGISNSQMGVYSSLLHSADEIGESDFEEIADRANVGPFWAMCDRRAEKLSRSLKRNEEFTFCGEIEQVVEALKDLSQFKENNVTFILSNIGLMRNTASEAAVRIRQHYVRQPNVTGRIGWSLFVGVTCVDGNLCMGFSFNRQKNTDQFVRELIGEIDQLVDKIISS